MRIKRLDISGFKSFCDETRVLFDHAVTAVVGPNGCGKSNIVDAIRWALGEQSAKTLRGKGMDDVIFAGSSNRGPQSMAEVTITFDNGDGLSHPAYVDYPEISITRRLHRDGSSDYLINKTPCRLMDIKDLFLGTGGGARAYSIVEQGRIGWIVSSRPEDRRELIEEAAGITKFRDARKRAEHRMDKTRQNLLRVSDIIREVERSLASLKRQASKAARYKKYKDELRDIDLHIASHRYLELRATGRTLTEQLETAEQEYSQLKDTIETLETRVASMRLDTQASRGQLDEAQLEAHSVNNAISVLENEISHLARDLERYKQSEHDFESVVENANRQSTELDNDLERISGEVERYEEECEQRRILTADLTEKETAARARLETLGAASNEAREQSSRERAREAASQSSLRALEARVQETQGRLNDIWDERRDLETQSVSFAKKLSGLEKQSTDIEKQLSSTRATELRETEIHERLSGELEECDVQRRRVRDDLQGKLSRKESIEEVMNSLEGHDTSVRDAVQMLSGEEGGLYEGLLIDTVECDARFEVALAAALGDRLQALLVREPRAGVEILKKVQEHDTGRVTVLPLSLVETKSDDGASIQDAAVLGPLHQFLKVSASAHGLVRHMVDGVLLVENLQDAERLWDTTHGRYSFVTLDGQLIESVGVMRGGRSTTAGAGLLGQKRQIRELSEEIEKLSYQHDHLEERFEILKGEYTARGQAAESARRQAQEHEVVIAEVRKDLDRAAEDLATARQRWEALGSAKSGQERLLTNLSAERDNASGELQEARGRITHWEHYLETQAEEIDLAKNAAAYAMSEVSDARVVEAQLKQKYESTLERISQMKQTSEALKERLARAVDDRERTYHDLGHTAGELFRKREELSVNLDKAAFAEEKVQGIKVGLDEFEARLAEAESQFKSKREQLDAASERTSSLKVDTLETQRETSYVIEGALERHQVELLKRLGDYHLRAIPDEDTFARMGELRQLIERMGNVNLTAIEEYEEQSTRYETLTGQRADIEQALEDLENTINQMNKEARRLFKDAFEEVNKRFQENFPILFNGGRAELILTEPDNLLTTGIDIVAQPPGKRLANLNLLSGGEKALTAVSLLFALFQYRPSPFCLLDEVDAPLDEANISRFVDMVRLMTDRSQFIMITHSKVTMEKSDVLYGVTMEEPGVSKMVSVRLARAVEEPPAVSA